MADERSLWDSIKDMSGEQWESIKNMSGKDWAEFGLESALYANPVTAGLSAFLSPSEANAGETEWVDAMNAVPGFLELSTEDQNRVIAERQAAPKGKPVKRPVSTEKPFISISRTDKPRSQATPPPTREDIISRLLAPKRGEYPPRTAAKTPPSMGLEFGDVKGLSPSNVKTTAARREAAVLKNKVIADAARKRRAAEARKVSTLLKERQAAPSKADIRSGEKAEKKRKIAAANKKRYQQRKASEIAKTKETRKAVGTMLKERQAKPSGEDIRVAREAETKRKAAKEKAREISLEKSAKKIGKEFRQPKVTPISKPKPKVVSEKKITKVKPKVVVKKVVKKKTTPIEADLGTGRKAHTVKSGQTLSGIAKQHGTTLKALLAANPKLKGRPNLIKVGEKIKIRGPLKKAASPYKGMTKKEWEKITTASQKQREQRSARKTGGGVGLHTAEMRSAGKDLHQPQSKIKKRIHEEITYAKKGGKVGKKKQGYKARKDESIAMRVKKKRTKKQLKASRSESYGKWGKGKGKGKINRFGSDLVASTYD